jgi:pimeloyl-ACP methyl ester carboxylesterase
MFHGYKSSAYLDFCGGIKFAIRSGHNVLIVDQRSHGNSDGTTITFGIKERHDCLSWIHYLNNRFGNDTPIILSGLSMGAATVLMASNLNLPDNVTGIVADCPYSSPKEILLKVCRDMHYPATLMFPFIKLGAFLFGHFNLTECDALSCVKESKVPILIFHGDDDRFVPCSMSLALKKANPEQITLEIVPGAGHGLCYVIGPKQYENALEQFYQRIL